MNDSKKGLFTPLALWRGAGGEATLWRGAGGEAVRKKPVGRIYISGRISGTDLDIVRRRFAKAERHCREQGYRTCNPMKMRLCVWLATHGHYRLCLWLELLWMWMTCDVIYLQEGWHQSNGARAERALARCLGITAVYENSRTTGSRTPDSIHRERGADSPAKRKKRDKRQQQHY